MNRKRAIAWILLLSVGAFSLVCASLYLFTSDERQSLTTNTQSAQLNTGAERVAFLGRYLKFRTPVKDAAFHIVYHDNSGGLPGPSDWSIVAVVRVSPADRAAWLADARPLGAGESSGERLPATAALIPAEWQVSSVGERYTREGALLVWHSEGVLEFAAVTN